ncbi:MAG: HIT family protein [bacterium]
MKNDNCIFCKLANGDIPTRTLYEDQDYRVIMDASPATRGHALVIPKDHYENLYEIPEDVAAGAVKVAKKMALVMKDKLGTAGLNLVQNNGEAAGQTVMHFHMHIIPRYEDDRAMLLWKHLDLSDAELDEIKNTING